MIWHRSVIKTKELRTEVLKANSGFHKIQDNFSNPVH